MDQSMIEDLAVQQVIEIAVNQLSASVDPVPIDGSGHVECEHGEGVEEVVHLEEHHSVDETLYKKVQSSITPSKVKRRRTKEYTRIFKPKLVDALGYMYNVKRIRKQGTTDWQCTARRRGLVCAATVKQENGNFSPGRQPHIHMLESQVNAIYEMQKGKKRKKKGKGGDVIATAMTEAGVAKTEKKRIPKKLGALVYLRPRLYDKRNGFTYIVKKIKRDRTVWKCVFKETDEKCPAVLEQVGGNFTCGSKPHCHCGSFHVEEGPKMMLKVTPKKGKESVKCTKNIVAAGKRRAKSVEQVLPIEPRPLESLPKTESTAYQMMHISSQRGHPRLIDSDGYTYNIKKSGRCVVWQCTVRNKKIFCQSTLKESEDGVITKGQHGHNHPPKEGAVLKSLVTSKIKAKALTDLLQPTQDIVREVLSQEMGDKEIPEDMKAINLVRMAARVREMKNKTYTDRIVNGIAGFQPSIANSYMYNEDSSSGSDEGSGKSDDDQ